MNLTIPVAFCQVTVALGVKDALAQTVDCSKVPPTLQQLTIMFSSTAVDVSMLRAIFNTA